MQENISLISLASKMQTTKMFGAEHGSHNNVCLHFRKALFPMMKLARFEQISFPVTAPKLGGLNKTNMMIRCCDGESNRTYKKLPPSEWTDHFLSLPINFLEMNVMEREIEELKPKVKAMLIIPSRGEVEESKKRMIFIYLLVCLGLACHFVDEIDENLKQSFEKREEMLADEDDLYMVSVIFWVFRTYGYNMSSDAFKRFTDEDGMFKECLLEDTKGMLSLYEAAHLQTRTEKILDEALRFTRSHLEFLAEGETSPPYISKLIKRSLYLPQRHNIEMLFAKEYISFYEQEEDHDKMLLRFSKINFRFLQFQCIQELKTLSKWWKEEEMASKIPPYFRDRMMESYFYLVGTQPQFSRSRIIATKIFMLCTIVDDTFDRYAFLSEIKILVDCIERLVPESVESLPDYMKPIFKFTLNVLNECQSLRSIEEEGSYGLVEEEFKILVRSSLSYDGKWKGANTLPTFDEATEVGDTEIGMYATLMLSFLGLGHKETKVAHKWLKSRPKLLRVLSRRARLLNDIAGFEDDMSRGHEVNVVNYYMKQHRVSKEETCRELQKMIGEIDKLINEEFLKMAKRMPIDIIQRAINCGNVTTLTYIDGNDGYSNPIGKFKDRLISLFVDLMPL